MLHKDGYLTGFGNFLESEALPGALPIGQNSPQKVPMGLYAEQLSGTAFTAPRASNQRSWFYRIRPSAVHGEYRLIDHTTFAIDPPNRPVPPHQLRTAPLSLPTKTESTDFVDGLITYAHNGSAAAGIGADIHMYSCNCDMGDRFFYNTDGDFLLVPQEGRLNIHTEFGVIDLAPGEIAVVPRGIRFQVNLTDKHARGYICENYGEPFILPERAVIGANGLSNDRDFQIPPASYHDSDHQTFELVMKFQGKLWQCDLQHHPLDVVAWHGNYYPYKYNLARFNTINSVSFDHMDPSIFTVLTSQTAIHGTANVDFVIFPERWMVAENTFRPPWYHRNLMSEFMGLIKGEYDAKQGGFLPGGASFHNRFSAHGPDAATFEKASKQKLVPEHYKNTLAFMFESRGVWCPSQFVLSSGLIDEDYLQCWQSINKNFMQP